MNTRGFSYRRTLARRDKLFCHALRPYIGMTIIGELVNDLCNDIEKELPASISRDALYESVRILAGTTLSQRDAKELAWRLAGNIDALNSGTRVVEWTQQVTDETVPVCVERVRPEKRYDELGYVFYCRVLAGSPCPKLFPIFFSKRTCARIAKTVGFSAPWGNYPYSTPWHYVGLLFFVTINAEKSKETLAISGVSANDSLLIENREKIAIRTRAKPCPRGYSHECTKCWLGYSECPAAIRPKTLVEKDCNTCNTKAMFEPDDIGNVCINCRAAQATAQPEHA